MLDRRELMRHALVLVGASVALSTLEACAPRAGSDHYLSRQRLAVLDEVAEIIIPQTDTPGARAAGVPAAFDKMLAQWASEDTQNAFDKILDDIDAKAREMHGGKLLELEPAERVAVVTAFDAENLARPAGPPSLGPLAPGAPPPAYPRFKDLILTTYYLSEPGATLELRHEIVPGPWRGDIPYSEVGRAWAY